jgi:hypothetical protein
MPKKKLFHIATNYPEVLEEKILKYLLIRNIIPIETIHMLRIITFAFSFCQGLHRFPRTKYQNPC